MWVYKRMDDKCWSVGYFTPGSNQWVSLKLVTKEMEAVDLVHYLNGGN